MRVGYPRSQDGPPASHVLAEVMSWITGVLMKPDPMLGRRGAVCPFLDQATKYGRISLNVIHLDGPEDFGRLRAAAADWLPRIRSAADSDGRSESVLFLPVGAEPAVLVDAVTQVQRELRCEAIRRGCMVGEFFPGHPMPGIHNPEFRPLNSPRPILGIRTMVDTDVLFLSMPAIPAAERARFLPTWHRFYGAVAAPALLDVYERARRGLDNDAQLERQS
jgi:uncharacterized protein DUF6875